MKNESVKKSLEKSKNVLEEKGKMVKQKICIKKTNTFTIIAMNFVQEQLNSSLMHVMTCKDPIEKKPAATEQCFVIGPPVLSPLLA